MLSKLIDFLHKTGYLIITCKNPRILSISFQKNLGLAIVSFLFVGQISAGLENSKDCVEPCKKKIKESTPSKKVGNPKKSSPVPNIQQEIPTDTNALKESIKSRVMYRQSYRGKLEHIKSITAQEIENQRLLENNSISESLFQPIQSDAIRPIPKEESFLWKDINENLKWKQK